MEESEKLRAEIELAEALLRTEASQLEELGEKRRLIVDGIAELQGPSEMWATYVADVDAMIAMTRARIDELMTLRDESQARLAMRQ